MQQDNTDNPQAQKAFNFMHTQLRAARDDPPRKRGYRGEAYSLAKETTKEELLALRAKGYTYKQIMIKIGALNVTQVAKILMYHGIIEGSKEWKKEAKKSKST